MSSFSKRRFKLWIYFDSDIDNRAPITAVLYDGEEEESDATLEAEEKGVTIKDALYQVGIKIEKDLERCALIDWLRD